MEANLQLGARSRKSIIDQGVKTPLRRIRKSAKRAFGR
jgi:hypothetical protein